MGSGALLQLITSQKGAEGPPPSQRDSCEWAVHNVRGSGRPLHSQAILGSPPRTASAALNECFPSFLHLDDLSVPWPWPLSVLSNSAGNERRWLGTLGTEQGHAGRPEVETELTVTGRLELNLGAQTICQPRGYVHGCHTHICLSTKRP